jgi:hypothetical protein
MRLVVRKLWWSTKTVLLAAVLVVHESPVLGKAWVICGKFYAVRNAPSDVAKLSPKADSVTA